MEKEQLKNLASLVNFKNELQETQMLIYALEAQVVATKETLDGLKLKEKPEYGKFKKYLEISDKQIGKLYELGFIALFANVECFMFDFLKDIFKQNPQSFQSEKIVKFEDIKNFKTMEEVEDYFIDSLAITKSYDIETWINFLKQKFGINIPKKSHDLLRFKALHSVRNLILHSGSKTNSKFSKEMEGFLKIPVPIGKPFKLDRKKYFNLLHDFLQVLIRDIENS